MTSSLMRKDALTAADSTGYGKEAPEGWPLPCAESPEEGRLDAEPDGGLPGHPEAGRRAGPTAPQKA